MAHVLITGGAGFIGSHLCKRLLHEGYDVICVDNLISGQESNIASLKSNPAFRFLPYDVIQPLPQDLKADFVFHLASPASPNKHSAISYMSHPLETMLVNTTGTMEVAKFAQKNNAKFLFASTSEIYGDPLEHPQKETYRGNVSTIGPRSVYDEAKRFGETITSYYWRQGVDARIARLFNTYGPNMHKEDMRMIVQFISQALAEKPITVYGDGSQTRSATYIDDTIDGLMKLMFTEGTMKQVVNIGSTDEHSVLEYAEMIKKLIGSSSEIVFSEALPEDDPRQRQPDISKARQLLNWEPKTSLEEGLQRMIEYMKKIV